MNQFLKISKVFVIALLVLAALLLTFHFWLLAHAKSILADLVQVQSKGRYHLQVKHLKYDYLKLRLELEQPVLATVDTNAPGDKLEMNAQYVSLQLEKLWPLISGRELFIDSILMDRPVLSLIHQKRNNNQLQKTAFSLSIEMEKLYQSIQSVLTTLKVANFRINKGAFILNSATQKNRFPFEIKDIDFYIKGFNIDSTAISQHPNSYTEDIQLRIAGQTIYFPDGNKSIQFSSFRFAANKGNLEVDSCSISGGDNDSTKASFNLFAEKMRIKNVFLAVNDSTDYNRIDSLFFTKPKVSFSIQLKDAKQDSSETIATAIRKITSAAFGRLLVRYMSINNVDFDIEVERKEKTSTFNFVQDSLVVSNLGVGLFPSMPLSASSIRFGVKEFVDYFRDSTYLVHFDSVRINNDQFALFNTKIESTAKVKKGSQKIFIPILQIQDIDWFQLISQKRLVASNLILNDPSIYIAAAGNSKNVKVKTNGSLEGLLRQMFVLKHISILNGSVTYAFSGNEHLTIKKINTYLTPEFLTSNLATSLQKVVRDLNGEELIYIKDGWNMTARKLMYEEQNSLIAGNIELLNKERSINIKANNVGITGLSGTSKSNLLTIKKINWKDANVIMDISKKQLNGNNSVLSIGSIKGGPTVVKLIGNKSRIEAKITTIQTGNITLENGKPTELLGLFVEGSSIHFITGNNNIQSGQFSVRDKSPSNISSLTVNLPDYKNPLNINVPKVEFEPDVQRSLTSGLDVNWINILQPKIEVTLNASPASPGINNQQPFPAIEIRNVLVKDPAIIFHRNNERLPLQLGLGNSEISFAAVKTTNSNWQLEFNGVKAASKNFTLNNKDSLSISAHNGTFTLGAKSFVVYQDSSKITQNKWQLLDGNIDLSNITVFNKRISGQADTLQLNSLHSDAISFSNNDVKDPGNYFSSSATFTFNNINLNYKNRKAGVMLKGLKGNSSSISLDSFMYRPQVSRIAFVAAQSYQKDYITLEAGPTFLNNIDMVSWLKDSVLRAGHLFISQAILNDTRDKHLPLEPNIIKGLPVTLIKNIPIKTLIDSVSIRDSKVRYHEISEKTNQMGNLRFTRLNAVIRNIKNHDFKYDDSLQVVASGYLMDSASILMQLKEAYNDTMGTFPITVRVHPFDMKILNPFLLPVMSVRIKSGIADSIQVRAVGKEYLSLGEMLFFYHDLKVEFLKAANDQKKTFLTGLITFAANSFVIRTKNSKRIGKIYYERSRNRSFFNYLVRMVASGAASSVGARRSPKYNRLYDEKIKELKLPVIDR